MKTHIILGIDPGIANTSLAVVKKTCQLLADYRRKGEKKVMPRDRETFIHHT